MPPAAGGHYRPNISNPFNQLPPVHNAHPQSHHYGHQPSNSNFNAQSFGTGGGFPAPAGHSNSNIFGPSLPNGGSFGGGIGSTGAGTGLGSHEAQMRFARGGAMQEQQGQLGADGPAPTRGSMRIREVWRGNLAQEMAVIRNLIDRYPIVSMDTEFPGVVARPMGHFPSKADYHFQCLRCNVDLLKLIQLGITLWTTDGELPPAQTDSGLNRGGYSTNLIPCPCTWTFNFQFSLADDMYSQDSIEMLQKAGLDFAKSEEMGIDPKEFGSLLITSGLVLDPDVAWLSFHSGYDFGYLVKMMACKQLPQDEEEYLGIVRTWFPRIYDIKYLFRHAQKLNTRGVLNQQASGIINGVGSRSGLQDLADELGCVREGRAHTAGSDAWLTGSVFWAMKDKVFDKNIPDDHIGMIWGLVGVGPPASAATQAAALAGQQTPATNGASLYHTGMTPSTHRDSPSTPQSNHTGQANNTPGPHGYGGAMGGLAGGAFSGFQYSRQAQEPLTNPTLVPVQPQKLSHGDNNYDRTRLEKPAISSLPPLPPERSTSRHQARMNASLIMSLQKPATEARSQAPAQYAGNSSLVQPVTPLTETLQRSATHTWHGPQKPRGYFHGHSHSEPKRIFTQPAPLLNEHRRGNETVNWNTQDNTHFPPLGAPLGGSNGRDVRGKPRR